MTDLYKLAIELAATIIIGAGMYLFNKYVKPWLVQNNLMMAAQIAVNAAEAMWGRYEGEKKLHDALHMLEVKGWDITGDDVIAAVNAAWLKLNTAQIASGEKIIVTEQNYMENK